MTDLAQRAAAAAGRTDTSTTGPAEQPQPAEAFAPAPDPMADYEPGDDEPEMVPVHVAWLRVRRDIRAIAKRETYNAPGTRFNFRGVDTVVNTFGPVTLKHGVHVMSSNVEATYGEKNSKNGGRMRECSVLVTWTIMGPKGDTLTLQTMGEALDTADKSTSKAQSVALRTLLLGFGLTPTHDPDPDAERNERGHAPPRPLTEYRDEALDPGTSKGRMSQMVYELRQQQRANQTVANETGEDEGIEALIMRKGNERGFAGGGQ